jgi:hypothetical protein
MTWKQLLDENTWHGKGIRRAQSAPKVAIVLVFFFGLFSVIAARWALDRLQSKPQHKRLSRT